MLWLKHSVTSRLNSAELKHQISVAGTLMVSESQTGSMPATHYFNAEEAILNKRVTLLTNHQGELFRGNVLLWMYWPDCQSTLEDCKEEVFTVTLTKEQAASSQGPADLHVMSFHVLAGNVLHRNLLCNLGRGDESKQETHWFLVQQSVLKERKEKILSSAQCVFVVAPSSQSRSCLCSHHRWPCLRTTGKQNSPLWETKHCNDPGTP